MLEGKYSWKIHGQLQMYLDDVDDRIPEGGDVGGTPHRDWVYD